MKIIPIVIISFLIMSNSIAQKSMNKEKNDSHYIELIKAAFYEKKLDDSKELPFLKFRRYRKELLKSHNNDTLQHHISTKLLDFANQKMVILMTCLNNIHYDPNSNCQNILALIDVKNDCVISILRNSFLSGLSGINWTKDYIVAHQAGSGLLAWNRITGESYGEVYSGTIFRFEVKENTNKVFILSSLSEHSYSSYIDIDDNI